MTPSTGGMGSHGGYCGPAVKPIALNMVAEIARDPATAGLPISGIGGIATWRDAAEFIALGAGNVQVCTAAMVYGFKIVQDMSDGLSNYMDEKGYATRRPMVGPGRAHRHRLEATSTSTTSTRRSSTRTCASSAGAATSCAKTPRTRRSRPRRTASATSRCIDDECVGCNLCVSICPVPDCITMRRCSPARSTRAPGRW